MRALVIDDEQIVLDSVRKILSGEGFEVDTSIDSRQGLDTALEKEYDVVLSDIRMPYIGGMRILRDLRRSRPSCPVIIITGYATVKSAVQAMKLGANDYIEKPFTPEELIAAVDKAINAQKRKSPEVQEIIHKETVIKVLERAAHDTDFVSRLFYDSADALEEYDLTGPEKLAILTGDIPWIEEHVGSLTPTQKRWLEQRLSMEIW